MFDSDSDRMIRWTATAPPQACHSLAQGCTGQLTVVQAELFTGNVPPIRAYDPPGTDA